MSESAEPGPKGLIPQSQLLAEASEDSLSELFPEIQRVSPGRIGTKL